MSLPGIEEYVKEFTSKRVLVGKRELSIRLRFSTFRKSKG